MTMAEYKKLKEEKERREFYADMSDWYEVTLRERAEIEKWWRTVCERIVAEGITEE